MDAYIEYAAVFFGIVYVLLASRGNVWCWPAGIISSFLYIYINVTHQLFQDGILQTYYVFAGFYGWWIWHRKDIKLDEKGITTLSLQQNLKLIFVGAMLVPVFGLIFSKFGNALSYFDATVTVFSFIATWMTAKKILQSWLFWIAIDITAAVMYFFRGLEPTVFLYVVYTLIAVYGYFEWRKKIRTV